MFVPGSNLLNIAFQVIAQTPVQWLKSNGRTENALGQQITSYDPAVMIKGSLQPVDTKVYKELGLDMHRRYFNFYSSSAVEPVGRLTGGDILISNGLRYQVEDEINWTQIDGWRGVLIVEVGDDQ